MDNKETHLGKYFITTLIINAGLSFAIYKLFGPEIGILFAICLSTTIIATSLIGIENIIIKTTKKEEAKKYNISMLNDDISKKIKDTELLLGIAYPNFKEIHDQIINNDIDITYIRDDFNFNKISPNELCGEIAMFKDLESGQLDKSVFSEDSLDVISDKLLVMFRNIDRNKRKSLANTIFKNNN